MSATGAHAPNGAAGAPADGPLLRVRGLSVRFATPRGTVHAVSDVDLDLDAGRTLAVVGESGSGKSVLARSLLRLHAASVATQAGSVRLGGRELSTLDEAALRGVRGREVAMVFQDPMSSLNPVLTVERQIGEVLERHLGLRGAARRERTVSLLDEVGIAGAAQRLREYPHQLSGGMRQRVMIAMALACRPRLLIADEPTTALDVTIQMQILVLLKRRQRETGMAMLFISHDLGAVGGVADEVAVMYGGRIVEQAPVDAFFDARRMPYSEALLRARPGIDAPRGTRLEAIGGRPPDLAALPPGCAFAPRCTRAAADCRTRCPDLVAEGARRYACLHPIAGPAVGALAG